MIAKSFSEETNALNNAVGTFIRTPLANPVFSGALPPEGFPTSPWILFDGIYGQIGDLHRNWIVMQDHDLALTMDYKDETPVKHIRLRFLQDFWWSVYFPEKISIDFKYPDGSRKTVWSRSWTPREVMGAGSYYVKTYDAELEAGTPSQIIIKASPLENLTGDTANKQDHILLVTDELSIE